MGRPRSQAARDKALAAAAEIALATGLSSVTIDEISRRSGVAKTTIYRHFEHRNAILMAALDQITSVPRTPDTGSLRDDLVMFYSDLIPIFADLRIQTLSFEIYAAASRDPELRDMHRAFFERRMGPMRTIIIAAINRGDLAPPDDFIAIVEIVHGPLIVRSLTAPESLRRLDPGALADEAARRLTTRP